MTYVLLMSRQQEKEKSKPMVDWIKPYPLMSVYRSDLLRVSLTQEQIEAFTDEDMFKLVNIMAITYLEGGFYTHLLAAVEQVMQQKEEPKQ